MKAISKVLAVLLAGVHMSGCYTFAEIPRSAVRDGANIRVMVQADEALRQQQALGRLTQELEGAVVSGQSDEVLGLTVAQRSAGPAGASAFNTFVTLPWSSVVRVEEKRFSTVKTVALAGAGVAIVLGALAIDGGGTNNGDGDPNTDSRIRIPLIRIPFR